MSAAFLGPDSPKSHFPIFKFRTINLLDENTSAVAFIFIPSGESVLETDTAATAFSSAIAAKTGLSITFLNSLRTAFGEPLLLVKDQGAQFIVSKGENCAYLFLNASPPKVEQIKAALEALGLKEELKGDGGTGSTGDTGAVAPL